MQFHSLLLFCFVDASKPTCPQLENDEARGWELFFFLIFQLENLGYFLRGYPSSRSQHITPYGPIRPVYNSYIGGKGWYIYIYISGTLPRVPQLFPFPPLRPLSHAGTREAKITMEIDAKVENPRFQPYPKKRHV